MTLNSNNIDRATSLISEINTVNPQNVKRIKRENGLLERSDKDNEKIILAEDNRQMLFG